MVSLYLRKCAQVFMLNIEHVTFYHDLVVVSKVWKKNFDALDLFMVQKHKGVISFGGIFLYF